MIKRPLNPRFNAAILAGRKITTIRDNLWPLNQPVMLYNWSGAAYRSKQIDVAAVQVVGFWPVLITRREDDAMIYDAGMEKPLHETEGFESPAALDAWFRPLLKPGQTVRKYLMRFRLVKYCECWLCLNTGPNGECEKCGYPPSPKRIKECDEIARTAENFLYGADLSQPLGLKIIQA